MWYIFINKRELPWYVIWYIYIYKRRQRAGGGGWFWLFEGERVHWERVLSARVVQWTQCALRSTHRGRRHFRKRPVCFFSPPRIIPSFSYIHTSCDVWYTRGTFYSRVLVSVKGKSVELIRPLVGSSDRFAAAPRGDRFFRAHALSHITLYIYIYSSLGMWVCVSVCVCAKAYIIYKIASTIRSQSYFFF